MNTTDTKWLSGPEQSAWRAWLFSGLSAVGNIDADLKALGMDLLEYHILVQASERPGLRPSTLSASLLASPQRLNQRLRAMEAAGWIKLTADPSDARARCVTLTDSGVARLKAAAPDHVESVRRHLIDSLEPGDLEALGRISERILKRNGGAKYASTEASDS